MKTRCYCSPFMQEPHVFELKAGTILATLKLCFWTLCVAVLCVVLICWTPVKFLNSDCFVKDPSNKRQIICDEKLKELFDVDSFNGFTVTKLLAPHFIKTQQWVACTLLQSSMGWLGNFVYHVSFLRRFPLCPVGMPAEGIEICKMTDFQ